MFFQIFFFSIGAWSPASLGRRFSPPWMVVLFPPAVLHSVLGYHNVGWPNPHAKFVTPFSLSSPFPPFGVASPSTLEKCVCPCCLSPPPIAFLLDTRQQRRIKRNPPFPLRSRPSSEGMVSAAPISPLASLFPSFLAFFVGSDLIFFFPAACFRANIIS